MSLELQCIIIISTTPNSYSYNSTFKSRTLPHVWHLAKQLAPSPSLSKGREPDFFGNLKSGESDKKKSWGWGTERREESFERETEGKALFMVLSTFESSNF